MLNGNVQFSNTSNGFEAMLEAFFNVQPIEHVKAWRWHQYTSKYDQDAVDAALAKASAQFRSNCNG